VPISSVVVKSDTAAVKEIKVDDLMKNKRSCTKSDKKFECVFVVGDKAKIRIIKTGIKTIPILRFYQALKKAMLSLGPYNTVSKKIKFG
jgi:HlyD family secretion protein